MKKIILAEDSEDLREALVLNLSYEFKNLVIEEVADGESLVEKVREGGFSVIITDNDMPYMDGLEAIRKIREFDQETPIYMLSGSDAVEEALEAGATGYICKSNMFPTLVDTLRKHLE